MKHKTTDRAKVVAKKRYGFCCAVTGLNTKYAAIDGCHIFPAGSYPQFKNYDENIVPCNRQFHLLKLDQSGNYLNEPTKRIAILSECVIPDFRQRFLEQMDELNNLVKGETK